MKRITFLAMFVAMVLGMNAQSSKTMHIWKDGVATNFLIASEIDSITFSDGNIDKENVNPVKGDYIWPILLDNITFEANASKIVADFRPNDINNFFYIWSTGETYIDNSPGTGLNFYGNDEGYLSLTVAAPDGWSGCGFCLKDEECAAAADALRKEIIANPNEYFLHLAIKSTNTGNHQFYTFNNQSTSFAIGTTTIEAGDVIGNFTRDGEWYEFNIPMANFVTALNTIGDFPVEGNILCVLSGGLKGSELNLDAVYFYKKAESENPPIDSEEPEEPTPSAGIGTFSVSADKQVSFSKGNLQYTQSTNTWSFASAQYEMIGTDNVTGGSVTSGPSGDSKVGNALADKIDLFGWSGSTGSAKFGVSTSTDYADYSGSFVDWGTNQIGDDAPNTWRTLTYDEWYYVVVYRPNASSLVGVAQVNGVNGLILLPDNWACPSGITFKSGFHSSDGVDYYAAYQTFTADQWSQLEGAGAVFLPAAGNRSGLNADRVQYSCRYWSATENTSRYADYLYFNSVGAGMYAIDRSYGHSVRLVKDL